MNDKILESERLLLRGFELEDANDMFKNWATNENVTRYVTWQPHKNIDETLEIIKKFKEAFEGDMPNWAIVYKENNEVIGNIAIVRYNEKLHYCEIGYCLSERYWNKGIMTEALKEVIKYCFNVLKVERVEAMHDIDNLSSGRVMQKAGMTKEGILRNRNTNNTNKIATVVMYSIIKNEFKGE